MQYKFINHELNVDLWESKEALKRSFYTDFYNFIKNNNGEADLKEHNIKNAEDFIAFAPYLEAEIIRYRLINNLSWNEIGEVLFMDRRTASRKFYSYIENS